jgi:hypothetical protein
VSSERLIDDVTLRAYFASVIAPFRQPFGTRNSFPFAAGPVSESRLALNSTKDRTISVIVTRRDVGGAANPVTFSQQPNGASSNDFSTIFTGVGQFRFTLKPGEQLSLQSSGTAAMMVVVGQETY